MLIKIKTQLPIIGCLILPVKRLEQFLDVVFDKEGTTKNTHDLKHWSIEFEVMLYDGDETICNDDNMYLDSYGIFRCFQDLIKSICSRYGNIRDSLNTHAKQPSEGKVRFDFCK